MILSCLVFTASVMASDISPCVTQALVSTVTVHVPVFEQEISA